MKNRKRKNNIAAMFAPVQASAPKTDNPILNIMERARVEKDRDPNAAKRWRNVAIISGISDAFSLMGKAVSAAAGAKVTPFNLSTHKAARKAVQSINKDYRRDSDQYFKGLLSEAIRDNKRKQKLDDDSLNAQRRKELESVRIDARKEYNEKRSEAQRIKTEQDRAFRRELEQQKAQTRKEVTAMNQAHSRAMTLLRKSTGGANGNYKPITYIKDLNNKTIPLYTDDVGQLMSIMKNTSYMKSFVDSKTLLEKNIRMQIICQRAYNKTYKDYKKGLLSFENKKMIPSYLESIILSE